MTAETTFELASVPLRSSFGGHPLSSAAVRGLPPIGKENQMVGKILAPLAGFMLAASPVLAQGPAAAPVGAPVENANQLEGGNWFPPILALAIIVGGVLLATGVIFDNDDDTPTSP